MVRFRPLRFTSVLIVAAAFGLAGCHLARPRTFVPRKGDEIVVAGQLFHTGARVVTWMDPGGYDAYRTERRFSAFEESSWGKNKDAGKNVHAPPRYGLRPGPLTAGENERGGGGGLGFAEPQKKGDPIR